MWLLWMLVLLCWLPMALCTEAADTSVHLKDTRLQFYAAMAKIAAFNPDPPVADSEYFDEKVKRIPQYNTEKQDYEGVEAITDTTARDFMLQEVIPELESAASANFSEALVTLADIYTFGNFSVPTNYTKALSYYDRAVSTTANGHAYFMLGFFYSTGMFGEIPSDQAKAQLYYQLGMEAGDINALLALAYRLMNGIGCPRNCELALMYYSKLARMGHQYLVEHHDEMEPSDVSYNIELPDFIGGIYGPDVSESPDTVVKLRRKILHEYEQEYSIDSFDRKIVVNFFSALDEYDGHYDQEKNYTRAKELLEECTEYGSHLYRLSDPLLLSANDRYRLSECQSLLGHMYLKGQGTAKDYTKAYEFLYELTRLHNTTDSLNDLGYMFEKGLVDGTPNPVKASEYYSSAFKLNSARAGRHIANLLVEQTPYGDIMTSPQRQDIVLSMQKAARGGDLEALYLFSEFIQSGYTNGITRSYSCYSTLPYLRIFLERLQGFFFPHLNYALDELNHYRYKNALTGFLIAAEQGLERAQVSAGWLLYQSDPFLQKGKKTFDHERVSHAIEYLQRASDQGNVDTTIFLGDIYFYGVASADIPVDYEKAFNLYRVAANSKSPHGCFNLAYMYEHGLGVVDGSIDFYMAKRYYDLALKYKDEAHSGASNQIPMYFALLKLRAKYLLWGTKSKMDQEQTSWFSTFKRLGALEEKDAEARKKAEEQAENRAKQQHEGVDDDTQFEDVLAIGDYFVLGITFLIFVVIIARGFMRGVVEQLRFMNQGNDNPNNGQPNENVREGWRFNGAGVEFRRGNFQFQFMGL